MLKHTNKNLYNVEAHILTPHYTYCFYYIKVTYVIQRDCMSARVNVVKWTFFYEAQMHMYP